MNYLKIFSIITLILMTGCSTVKPISEINMSSTEIKYITIPEDLLTPCKPNKPMSSKDYLELTFTEREAYLTNYSIHLLTELKSCNNKISKIKLLQEKLHESKP